MSKRKALGRGIEALLQTQNDYEEIKESIQYISTEQLSSNPYQPRKDFSEESIDELTNSIKKKGVLQPLIVEKNGESEYTIIAGERRFRAAEKAGINEVPVIVRKLSEEEKLEIALIENIQREDLTPIEEAVAYKKLMETADLNQEQISTRLGKKRSTIANSLRLLKLPESIQTSINKKEISAGHARALLSLLNPSDVEFLFQQIIDEGLSVRETEKRTHALNQGKKTKSEKQIQKHEKQNNKPAELKMLEKKFIDRLGTKVLIRGNNHNGKIEISYFSLDDLNRIYEIIRDDQ